MRKASLVFACTVLVVAIFCITPAFGQLGSIPIDPRAQILQPEQTISVPASAGSGAHVSVPGHGVFSIDFAVEPGKQLLLMVITNEQYNAILQGRQAGGNPLMRINISGNRVADHRARPGRILRLPRQRRADEYPNDLSNDLAAHVARGAQRGAQARFPGETFPSPPRNARIRRFATLS